MVASGGASGRRETGPRASISAAPDDAGPGLPRAAPSVLTISVRRLEGAEAGRAGRPADALGSDARRAGSSPDPGSAPRDSQSESQLASLGLSLVAPRSPRRPRG